MFINVLTEETRENISVVSTLELLKCFYLAGGTGCALHIGHRVSRDLDMLVDIKWEHVKKFFREQKAILDYAVLHGIKFK